MKRINDQKLKNKIIRAMRRATPKDTGNLAYNALRVYRTKDGFKTVYLGRVAGYGKILNQTMFRGTNRFGNAKKNRHFGWHPRAVYNGVLMVGKYFNPKMKVKKYDTNQVAKYKEDNLESQMAAKQQINKWLNNTARKKFEQENKV